MNEPIKLTKDQQAVLDALQRSPHTRQMLELHVFGTAGNSTNDRTVRRAIAELRELGYVIFSSSGTTGYELTTDPQKVRHYVAEQKKAAIARMRLARKVQRAYKMLDQLPLSS
jgi:Fe2+ or Zn2+ uptake regulation protein